MEEQWRMGTWEEWRRFASKKRASIAFLPHFPFISIHKYTAVQNYCVKDLSPAFSLPLINEICTSECLCKISWPFTMRQNSDCSNIDSLTSELTNKKGVHSHNAQIQQLLSYPISFLSTLQCNRGPLASIQSRAIITGPLHILSMRANPSH